MVNGYDQTLLKQYKKLLSGVYFNLSGNVPFQAASKWPQFYPGMVNYIKQMDKYQPTWTEDLVASQGGSQPTCWPRGCAWLDRTSPSNESSS